MSAVLRFSFEPRRRSRAASSHQRRLVPAGWIGWGCHMSLASPCMGCRCWVRTARPEPSDSQRLRPSSSVLLALARAPLQALCKRPWARIGGSSASLTLRRCPCWTERRTRRCVTKSAGWPVPQMESAMQSINLRVQKEVRGQLLITSQSGSVKASKGGQCLQAHPSPDPESVLLYLPGGCSCTCLETSAASGGARGGTAKS